MILINAFFSSPLPEVFSKPRTLLIVGCAVRVSPDLVPVPIGNKREQSKQVKNKKKQPAPARILSGGK